MTTNFAVISAIGTDRVGIVDEFSGFIADVGGNVEESKMAVLGGDFSVMMLVSLDQKALDSLLSRVDEMESRLGLKIAVTPTKQASVPADGRPYFLESVSLDGRGILHEVSAVLHRHGVNIEELETSTVGAPLTGAPLFRLRASVVLGPAVHVAQLRRDLEALEVSRELDVTLSPLLPGPARE